MLLMVFSVSLGLILGALGAFLGALLVFVRAFGDTLHAQNFFWDSLPGQIYCHFFVSAFAPFFEIIVSLILEPLRVDFELPN